MKLITAKPTEPRSQADPYIEEFDGRFYIYATGSKGVTVWQADSLQGEWRYAGEALTVEGQHEYWAPCVIRVDGMIYMYYSSFTTESDDVHLGCIKVAKSPSPTGPFTYVTDLCAPFSIDPHVVQNEDGLFMFYSVNDYEAERAGTYIVCDRMKSPTEMAGEPVEVVRATLDEEIFCRDRFRKGQHWHTLEGAFYFEQDGTHYCTYSGNCYENETYYVGYATAKGGSDLTKLIWQKHPAPDVYAPLLAKNDVEEGTGHNSVIAVDGKRYIVYHGRDYGTRGTANDVRTARICEIEVTDGIITVTKR